MPFDHAYQVPRPPAQPDDLSTYVVDFLNRHGQPRDDARTAVHNMPPASIHASAQYAYHAEVAIAQAHETYAELRRAQRINRSLPYVYVVAVIVAVVSQFLPEPWSLILTIAAAVIPVIALLRMAASLKASRP